MAVVSGHRGIGDQHTRGAARSLAGRNQARVVRREAREHREESDREQPAGGDRNRSNRGCMAIERGRRQQGQGGQSRVQVAVAPGVRAGGHQRYHCAQVQQGRDVDEAQSSAVRRRRRAARQGHETDKAKREQR